MGYGAEQSRELVATIRATPCDVVVSGTPIDLAAALGPDLGHPVRHATYELDPVTITRLGDLVDGWMARPRLDSDTAKPPVGAPPP
jgi:predicted GTPase